MHHRRTNPTKHIADKKLRQREWIRTHDRKNIEESLSKLREYEEDDANDVDSSTAYTNGPFI